MLVLDGVTAGYGTATVLRDVHLTVPRSSVVALLGPNGAGKTTLLRVASGLVSPWSGAVLLEGEDVTGLSPDGLARRGVCHVPEGRGVFPPLSVRENLLLFSPPGEERVGLERALEAFPDLAGRLDQTAGTMSGGQQQMLALARAYIAGGRVILLDEVSMGLAPIVVDEIFAFLERVAGEGVSLLLVEQYVNKALAIADYGYILSRGRISFAGDAAELADEDVFSRYLGIEVGAG
ncbi:MAG: branched-chain amino acid transport system ATP-binding protein [Actinomycetota bacterium]|jgi:branched-chain amino acid transport system ATP-binding protein|nr:branched-chain amino acid transport system ATP-binding protein [Actinomycetota bacterium]